MFKNKTLIALLALIIITMLLPLEAKSEKNRKPGWHNKLLYHNTFFRQYRYYIPHTFSKDRPTVILLHEGGENMNNMFVRSAGGVNEWPDLAEKEGFLLLVPNGTDLKSGESRGHHLYWNDCRPRTMRTGKRSYSNDVAFVEKLIDQMVKRYDLNPGRIYAVGSGEGGMMALRLGFEIPEKVAAVGALHCSLSLNSSCDRANLPFPLVLFNGTKDPVFKWMGGHLRERDGHLLSVPRTRNSIIAYNRCDRNGVVITQIEDRDLADGSSITRSFYPGRFRGADFCFYKIQGGGHLMPTIKHPVSKRIQKELGSQNHDIETSVEVWSFLRQYDLTTRRVE